MTKPICGDHRSKNSKITCALPEGHAYTSGNEWSAWHVGYGTRASFCWRVEK